MEQMTRATLQRIENIVGNGENVGKLQFLFLNNVFKSLFLRLVSLKLAVVMDKRLKNETFILNQQNSFYLLYILFIGMSLDSKQCRFRTRQRVLQSPQMEQKYIYCKKVKPLHF